MRFLRFLSYNNAVPIAVSVILLGAGSAFAAGNPDAILASQASVVSVDNTYIANKDLSTYTPQMEIVGVTEDANNYYVAYNFTTIDIKDYIWRDVVRSERMQISKKELEGDLGLYVTKRLRDVINNERAYLAQVQEKERKFVTQQTIATTYSGLIGKFLDAKTETIPGYVPVIAPPVPEVAAVAANQGPDSVQSTAQIQISSSSSGGGAGGPAQVSLQILGNNPAQVALHASYVDLGVVLLDPFGTNVGVHTFVDGKETSTSPSIDTGTSAVHTIEYRATDPAGGVAFVRRVVLIGDAVDPGGELSSSGTPVAPPPVVVPTPITVPVLMVPETQLNPFGTSIPETASPSSPVESADIPSDKSASTSPLTPR